MNGRLPRGARGPQRGPRLLVGFAASTALVVSVCSTTSAGSVAPGSGAAGVGLRISLGSSFVDGRFKGSSTCDDPGHDYSPELAFQQVSPAGSLALTMVDLDNAKVHWIQTGIPGDAEGIKEHTLVAGAREWTNDLSEATYDGPCPPSGETHRYRLTLYALSSPVDLGAARTPSAAVQQIETASTARSDVVAFYTRTP